MAEDTNRNPNPPSRGAAGSVYFPLFQHMADNHGLTLLDSEMEDICRVVEAMRPPLQPCQLSGDTVLMSALEAMSAPSSSSERAQFTERLLSRLHRLEASRSSMAEPSLYKGEVVGSTPTVTTTDTPNKDYRRLLFA